MESYTYDYAGNRTSKTVNEGGTTYYVTDTGSSLSQVVAEVDGDGRETASYTLGDERISVERDGRIWYYLHDGHGSVRMLAGEDGQITDSYSYDAYGNLLEREGDTENDFLYTGEQYNANTGLYYLRARYMNPDTGTFISMDSYPGSTGDPVSLHKYLYANANPVMYTDPSGYFSLAECSAVTSIQSALNSMHQITAIRNIIRWADAACTVYDTAMEIRNVLLGGGSIEDVAGALLKGVVVGFMVDGMCKTSLGIILKPMMAIFGLGDQAYQLQEAIRSGDPVEITVRFVQLACMLFGLTSQCFTGDTLVSTEHGLRPIEEIQAGDYVWSENTETGEKELKKVLGVSVTETTVLVHVSMEDGTEINTTENHPFYVEGKGWCAASGLEDGDILHAQDGSAVTVKDVEARQLDEAVKVYNLEIEEYHTYYVSGREVLVHNVCNNGTGVEGDINSPSECNISSKQFGKKWGKHKTDYPDLSMNEYKNLIDDVFKSPDKIIQDVQNNEFLYLKENNLLRVTNNGEFISLYPGAESGKVLSAIEKGGTIWPK